MNAIGSLVIDRSNDRVYAVASSYFAANPSDIIGIADGNGTPIGSIPVPGVVNAVLSPDSRLLYGAVPGSNAVVAIDVAERRVIRTVTLPGGSSPRYLALAAGRLYVGYASGFGEVDLQGFTFKPVRQGYGNTPVLASAGPDSRVLFVSNNTSYSNADVERWDLSSQPVRTHTYSRMFAGGVTATPDGTRVILGGYSYAPSLSAHDLTEKERYNTGGEFAYGATFSADGSRFVISTFSPTGDYEGLLPLYVPGVEAPIRTLGVPDDHFGGTFTPDGRGLLVVTGPSEREPQPRIVRLPLFGADPARLSVKATQQDGDVGRVSISGRLSFTDGTPAAGRTITVARSGPEGTVPLAPATTGGDGSFAVEDVPPGPAARTYRAHWTGDADHDAVLAIVSVNGGLGVDPLLPAPPARPAAIRLPFNGAAGLAVDDLHHRLFVVGPPPSQATTPGIGQLLALDLDGALIRRFDLPSPVAIALSRDHTTLYVSEYASSTIAVLDTATLEIVGRWSTELSTKKPLDIAEAGGRLWYSYTTGGSGRGIVSFPLSSPADTHDTAEIEVHGVTFETSPSEPNVLFVLRGERITRHDATDPALPALARGVKQTNGQDLPLGGVADVTSRGTVIWNGYEADAKSLTLIRHYAGSGGVQAVTADGRFLAMGSSDPEDVQPPFKKIKLYRTGTTTPEFEFALPWVDGDLAFSGDSSRLYALTTPNYRDELVLRIIANPLIPCPQANADCDVVPRVVDLDPLLPGIDIPGVGPAGPLPVPVPGYWMIDETGVVTAFGTAAHFGDLGGRAHNVTDIEPAPTRRGYWILEASGTVHGFGDSKVLGEHPQLAEGERATSLSATPSGGGYWIFTSTGRSLAYGNAAHYGDLNGIRLNGPVLDSVATPSGAGYYMVASDGGIFAFGDARFHGSMGGRRLNAPVESLVPTPAGTGYWLVAADGGVFAFSAPFRGSLGGIRLNKPVTGMVAYGDGYVMAGQDGGIFAFSNLPFAGSLGARPPSAALVAVAS